MGKPFQTAIPFTDFMRNLLTDPEWQGDTLGSPLPDSPHAVSVSLPLWEHVIGYEEGTESVVSRMRSGYPRFFLPPLTQKLFQEAESKFAGPGEGCLVFPSQIAAERCCAFVAEREPDCPLRLEEMEPSGLWVVIFPAAIRPTVRLFWRFSGEIVSSRWAAAAMGGIGDQPALGAAAKATIRKRLARYSGVSGSDVFLFASGMAAIFTVQRMLTATQPGLPTVQLDFPYVDVLKVQEQFGSGVRFFPRVTDAALAEVAHLACERSIAGVYCEVPSNPLLSCLPLADLAPVLREHCIPLVVDDTIATVMNVDALKYADVVTTSLTKSFSGVGDVLAGAVTLNPLAPHYAAFRAFLEAEMELNDHFWWEDAIVLEANSRDFPKRTRRSSQNAAALAEFLRSHPAVDRVYYPTEATSGLEMIRRSHGGRGCLLTFTLKQPEHVPAVYDALRVCKGPSLGANFTLVCPYTMLAHYTELGWAEDCGVPARLLRVSAGLEEPGDLIERFRSALLLAV